jgi:hypothetical protein
LHFSLKGPAQSQVIKYQHKPITILRVKQLVASGLHATRSLPNLHYALQHANGLQLLKG